MLSIEVNLNVKLWGCKSSEVESVVLSDLEQANNRTMQRVDSIFIND
jgi:hypothetical protein